MIRTEQAHTTFPKVFCQLLFFYHPLNLMCSVYLVSAVDLYSKYLLDFPIKPCGLFEWAFSLLRRSPFMIHCHLLRFVLIPTTAGLICRALVLVLEELAVRQFALSMPFVIMQTSFISPVTCNYRLAVCVVNPITGKNL